MTADPPFLHPAEDPSIETTTLAWSRVDRTVRLRRAQRRTVGSALLAVAVLAVAVLGATGGDPGYETANDDLMIDADTGWTDPVLSENEMRLTIMVGSAPAGDTSCSENYEHQVVETDQSVTIELGQRRGSGHEAATHPPRRPRRPPRGVGRLRLHSHGAVPGPRGHPRCSAR